MCSSISPTYREIPEDEKRRSSRVKHAVVLLVESAKEISQKFAASRLAVGGTAAFLVTASCALEVVYDLRFEKKWWCSGAPYGTLF